MLGWFRNPDTRSLTGDEAGCDQLVAVCPDLSITALYSTMRASVMEGLRARGRGC